MSRRLRVSIPRGLVRSICATGYGRPQDANEKNIVPRFFVAVSDLKGKG